MDVLQEVRVDPVPMIKEEDEIIVVLENKPTTPSDAELGMWTCAVCTFRNPSANLRCDMCDTVAKNEFTWACTHCTMINSMENDSCEICGATKEGFLDLEGQWGGNAPIIEVKAPEEKFYCGICMDNVVVSNKCRLACVHEYCRECMESFVSLEIKEARVLNVTCPGINDETKKKCTAPFSQKDIKKIVTPEVYGAYERFVKMKTDSSWVECPTCNQLQKGDRFRPQMICEREECKKEFCFIHSAAHPGISCSEYVKKNKEVFKTDRKFLNVNTINCPNCTCGVPIAKSEGCNHMTCSQCNTEFCYLCGGAYMDGLHYASWNKILGCPDMKMSSESKVKARVTPKLMIARAVCWPLTWSICLCPLFLFIGLWAAFFSLWLCVMVVCAPCIAYYLYKRPFHGDVRKWCCAGPLSGFLLCWITGETFCCGFNPFWRCCQCKTDWW